MDPNQDGNIDFREFINLLAAGRKSITQIIEDIDLHEDEKEDGVDVEDVVRCIRQARRNLRLKIKVIFEEWAENVGKGEKDAMIDIATLQEALATPPWYIFQCRSYFFSEYCSLTTQGYVYGPFSFFSTKTETIKGLKN